MSKIRFFILALLTLFVNCRTFASENDSLLFSRNYELFRMLPEVNNLFSTGNPATLELINIDNLSFVQAGYSDLRKDLKYSVEPDGHYMYKLNSLGYRRIGKLVFKGEFSYNNSKYTGINCNSTLRFDHRYPYIIGDTTSGIQRSEEYFMSGAFGFPVSSKLSLGFDCNYSNSMGAKQKDPRNLNKISDFNLNGGINYKSGKVYSGATFGVRLFAEDLDFDVVANTKNNLFQFLGMGYFRFEANISYYNCLYEGKGLNGSVHFGIKGKKHDNLSNLEAKKYREEVRTGTSNRIIEGVADIIELAYSNRHVIVSSRAIHKIETTLSLFNLNGTEVDQDFRKVSLNGYPYDSLVTKSWIEGKEIVNEYKADIEYYLIRLNSNKKPLIETRVGTGFLYHSDTHNPVVNYGEYNALNNESYLNVRLNIYKSGFIISPYIGIDGTFNLSGEYSYNPIDKSFPSIPENDYMILTTEFFSEHGGIKAEKTLNKGKIRSFYIDVNFRYLHFTGEDVSGLSNSDIHLVTGFVF